jgi:16S rRNA (guanine1207-N2)-methyltransferase
VTNDHYFTPVPKAPSRPATFVVEDGPRRFVFASDRGVFAHGRLDRGTRLLLDALDIGPSDDVLDVGCGVGIVGIVCAARAPRGASVLLDVNERAVALSVDNARRNRCGNVEVLRGSAYEPLAGRRFDVIATNPPIRAGRAVVGAIIAGAPAHLKAGGRFYLVARTAHGAKTLGRLIADAFGDSEEIERGGGFRVYRASVPRPPAAAAVPKGI